MWMHWVNKTSAQLEKGALLGTFCATSPLPCNSWRHHGLVAFTHLFSCPTSRWWSFYKNPRRISFGVEDGSSWFGSRSCSTGVKANLLRFRKQEGAVSLRHLRNCCYIEIVAWSLKMVTSLHFQAGKCSTVAFGRWCRIRSASTGMLWCLWSSFATSPLQCGRRIWCFWMGVIQWWFKSDSVEVLWQCTTLSLVQQRKQGALVPHVVNRVNRHVASAAVWVTKHSLPIPLIRLSPSCSWAEPYRARPG